MVELPRIGAEIAGYRIESQLAHGGMAVVYVAEDIRLARKVALKVLALELSEDDNFRERFLRESRIATSIDHPNVIPIYDAGDEDGRLYIAMRLVGDSDLRTLLRTEGALEIDRAVGITTQVASALEVAHEHDLVHRDVKPANVLVRGRRSSRAHDHVYLSDFGLAKRTSSISGLTKTGQFVGTVSYTAPEQVQGQQVDGRTDIYALGCVLFEELTGRAPFRKEEDVAVVMAHLNEEAPSVRDFRPNCPPDLAAIVAKMLAKAPADRFQDCGELIDALADADPGHRSLPTMTAAAGGGAGEPPSDASAEVAEPAEVPEPSHESAVPAPPTKAAAGDEGGGSGGWRSQGRAGANRSAPIWLVGILAAAVIALAVIMVTSGGDDEPAGDSVEPAATTASTTPEDTPAGPGLDPVRWRQLSEAPTTRQQAAAAVVGGRIWIVGGLKGTGTAVSTKKVHAYDPAIDTWNAGPDLPVKLNHTMAVEYDGELVVIGGWQARGANLTARTSGDVWALRDGEWTELPPLNVPRAAGAAAVADDRIVVAGGQADGELVDTTEVFDGERWTEVASLPTPREHMGGASDGQYFYAVGGRELSSDANESTLERYDPASDQWESLPNMPTATGSFGAAVVGERMLVAVAGEDPTSAIDLVQGYDIPRERWSQMPPLPEPKHGMAVAAIGNALYVLGGASGPGHIDSTSTSYVLNFR